MEDMQGGGNAQGRAEDVIEPLYKHPQKTFSVRGPTENLRKT